HLAGVERSLALDDAALLALTAGLGVAGYHVDTLYDDLGLAGEGTLDLALLALVLAGQYVHGVAHLNIHSHFFRSSLHDFGSQGQDLHVVLVAQLAGHGPKDTGTSGVLVVLDQNSGILVETDIGAVGTADALGAADDHGLDDLALLHSAA